MMLEYKPEFRGGGGGGESQGATLSMNLANLGLISITYGLNFYFKRFTCMAWRVTPAVKPKHHKHNYSANASSARRALCKYLSILTCLSIMILFSQQLIEHIRTGVNRSYATFI